MQALTDAGWNLYLINEITAHWMRLRMRIKYMLMISIEKETLKYSNWVKKKATYKYGEHTMVYYGNRRKDLIESWLCDCALLIMFCNLFPLEKAIYKGEVQKNTKNHQLNPIMHLS